MNGDRILLVEDDKEIREGVEIFLKSQGYAVFQAADGVEGLKVLEEREIDLAIVDVMMPRMDGITMTAKLREKYDFPVIFLSAKSEEVDKILGLNMGADDYITKPFSMRELLARVKANIRRSEMVAAGPAAQAAGQRVELGRISIDTELMVAYKDGRALELTQREYELLKFLGSQRGKVFSREALMEHVWNYEGYVGDVRAVDVAVRRLREKIEDDPASPQFIVTRRGMGYFFNA